MRNIIILIIVQLVLNHSLKGQDDAINIGKWSYETSDNFDVSVFIENNKINLVLFKRSLEDRKLLKVRDTIKDEIKGFKNGIIELSVKNKDDFSYFTTEPTFKGNLYYDFLKIKGDTKLVVKGSIKDLLYFNIDFAVVLSCEDDIIIEPTTFWKTYYTPYPSFYCGKKVDYSQFSYFRDGGEYTFLDNKNLKINVKNDLIQYIVVDKIPISKTQNIINEISSYLNFEPTQEGTENKPIYLWSKGLLEVRLSTFIDLFGDGFTNYYSLTDMDFKTIAINNYHRTIEKYTVIDYKSVIYNILGRAHKCNDYDLACNIADSALVLDPECYPALYAKGAFRYKQKNYLSAQLFLEQAYKINQKYHPTLEFLLITYILTNKLDKATELVNKHETIISETSTSCISLGEYYRLKGNKDLSCHYFNLAKEKGHPNAEQFLNDYCK